jgi:hypothetical protein
VSEVAAKLEEPYVDLLAALLAFLADVYVLHEGRFVPTKHGSIG